MYWWYEKLAPGSFFPSSLAGHCVVRLTLLRRHMRIFERKERNANAHLLSTSFQNDLHIYFIFFSPFAPLFYRQRLLFRSFTCLYIYLFICFVSMLWLIAVWWWWWLRLGSPLKSWPPQFRDRYHPMQCVFVVRRFLALFGCVWRADAYPRLVQRIKQVIIIKYNKNRKNILWQ